MVTIISLWWAILLSGVWPVPDNGDGRMAATVPDAIWFGRPWSAIGKNLFDALMYGLLTAGVFGWLWPR